MMKKFLHSLKVLLAVLSIFLGTTAFGQSNAIYESYAIISINGGTNAFYDMGVSTPNPDFQGSNLGNFNSSNSLIVKGGQNKTVKCNGGDTTGGSLYYRVYLTSAGPSGSFIGIGMGFLGNDPGAGPGCQNQSWEGTSGTTNILTGLAAGNYTVEVYSEATGFPGSAFASNGGANYKATFTLNPITVTSAGGTGSPSANYATLAAAITAINGGTIHTGTIVCSVNAGYTETAPAGGYSITASGTAGNNITFVKSGAGANPTFTAFGGQTSGNLNDAVFKIIGGDYITIDGFTMQENGANTTTAAATNNMTEFGVALFYASTTNGAQNNTIQNCTITLNRAYTNTFGIYSNTRHSPTSMTALADASSIPGSNSNNKFYANSISNVNFGIVLIGSGISAAIDSGNDIGGTASGTGNNITNWGGGAASSAYYSLTANNYGIFSYQQINDNISFNAITSAALTSAVVEGGILKNYLSTGQPTGTITSTINNNTVTVTNAASAATTGGIVAINSQGLTPLLSTATISINNNTVQNSVLSGSTSTTNGITAIANLSLPGTLNITGNSVLNNSITATTATTGAFTGISNSGAAGTVNINSNILKGYTNNTNTAYSGSYVAITNSGAVVTALNINSNQIGDATTNACTYSLAAASSINNAIQNTAGASTCALSISNNIIQGLSFVSSGSVSAILNTSGFVGGNITINTNAIGTSSRNFVTYSAANSGALNGISTAGGSSTSVLSIQTNDFRGIVHSVAGSSVHSYLTNSFSTLSQNISSNTFTNLNVNTTGNVTFISNSVNAGTSGFKNINSNSIVTAFNKAGAGATVALYTDGGSSTSTTAHQNNNNNFSNITVTGATTITGWFNNDGTGSTPPKTITGNTFNNWTCGSGAVNVLQNNFGGTTSMSNNTITNITGTGAITGILQGGSGTIATLDIATNTITGLSSTGTAGAVTAISSGSTATTTNINNNAINTLSSTSTTATVAGISVSTSSNIFLNTINTLSCVGTTSGVTNGIMVTGGTAHSVFRNKIYDLTTSGAFTTTGSVNGIVLSGSTGATTANVYNNIVGELKAPTASSTDAVRGISITASGTTSTYRIYYNSVYLNASSSGANFGTTALYHTFSTTATTAALDSRNNILINNSTPAGTGFSVAFRRSAATNLNNYATTSNNNLFYAGTPGASNLIYNDGTNTDQTLALFQTRMATRDQISQTENTTFQSTTGSNANFLRIALGTTSYAESGAVAITTPSITTDYFGITRPFPSPVNGGTAPDMGASEFDGITAIVACVTPSAQATALTFGTNTATTVNATFTAATGTPTGYLVVRSIGVLGSNPVDGTTYTAGGTLGSGTIVQVGSSTSIAATTLTSNTAYTFTIFTYNSGSCSGGPKYRTTSPLTGVSNTCPVAPTSPVNSAITSSSATVSWTASGAGGIAGTISYVLEVYTDAGFTTALSGSPFSVGTAVTFNLTSLSPNTPYYYKIKANNTFCDSAYLSGVSFTTACATTGLTISQGFNSATIPACWSTAIVPIGGTATALQAATKISYVTAGSFPTTSPQEGSHTVLYNSFSVSADAGGEERLISLPITTTGTTSVNVDFYFRNENNTTYSSGLYLNEGVQIQYSTNGTTWTNAGLFYPRHDASLTAGTAAWNLKTLTLPVGAGNQALVYVAFKFHSEYGDNMFLDNVKIYPTPTPITVSSDVAICNGSSTTLTVSSTNTNYTYSWTPTTGLSPTTGSSVTANPTTTTTYTVTAVDGAMTTSGTVTVTVNPAPSDVTITPSATVCVNQITPLTATSTISGSINIGAISTTSVAANTPYRQAVTTNARMQYLVTKAELNAAGITGAANLTSLSFTTTSAGSGTLTSYAISMGNTAATSLTTTYLTPTFTNVYNGVNYIVTTGVNTHTFSTPFAWDGTSNVVINICHTGPGGTTAVVNVSTPAATSTTSSSGSTSCSTNTSTSTSANRPIMSFGYITSAPITWTPITDLYSDAGATIAYTTGQNLSTVYSKPTANRTYTATATLGSCTKTAVTTLTVNPLPTVIVSANANICANKITTLTATGTGVSYVWSSSIGGTLFSDAAATTAYTSGATAYAKTSATTIFTATGTSAASCTNTAATTLTVLPATTWTTGWDNGIPTDGTRPIIFSGNYTSSGDLEGCNCTINSGDVKIIAGNTMTLLDEIKMAGGTFTLESDANLIQKVDAPSVPNSGSIDAKRIIKINGNKEYNYLMSPLIGSNLRTNIYENAGVFTDAPLTLYHNETNNKFYNSVGTYILGRGLAVKEPSSGSGTLNVFFKGVPMNGAFNFNLSNTGTSTTGYNLTGNPYPSNINITTLYNLGSNSTNISQNFYFWDNTANTIYVQGGNSYDGAAYAVFNAVSGMGNGAGFLLDPSTSIPTKKPTEIVKVGQGFMVRSIETTNKSLAFNNTIRVGNGGNGYFGNPTKAATGDLSNRFWLNLSAPTNITTQIGIVYFEAGNNAFAKDDSEMNGLPSDVLYSVIGDKKALINGRSAFVSTDQIPLGSNNFARGNYTFSLGEHEGIFANGQNIYLKDKQTGIITNLSAGKYTFAANAGETTGRFEIVYLPEAVLATNISTKEEIQVYKDASDFVIKAQSKKLTKVELYDTSGRLILSANPNALQYRIESERLNEAMYILKISQGEKISTKKILK